MLIFIFFFNMKQVKQFTGGHIHTVLEVYDRNKHMQVFVTILMCVFWEKLKFHQFFNFFLFKLFLEGLKVIACIYYDIISISMQKFSLNWFLGQFSHRVPMSVCLCICLWRPETPTSGCRGVLGSKNILQILACNNRVFKNKQVFFPTSNFCVFWRLLVEERFANIGLLPLLLINLEYCWVPQIWRTNWNSRKKTVLCLLNDNCIFLV